MVLAYFAAHPLQNVLINLHLVMRQQLRLLIDACPWLLTRKMHLKFDEWGEKLSAGTNKPKDWQLMALCHFGDTFPWLNFVAFAAHRVDSFGSNRFFSPDTRCCFTLHVKLQKCGNARTSFTALKTRTNLNKISNVKSVTQIKENNVFILERHSTFFIRFSDINMLAFLHLTVQYAPSLNAMLKNFFHISRLLCFSSMLPLALAKTRCLPRVWATMLAISSE